MRSQKEKMLAGELYLADDPELASAYARAQGILAQFNATRADDVATLGALLAELVGHVGKGAIVKPSFRCDYGFNIALGARTFVNYDCVLLDCSTITIGEEVQIGPGVHIYTATHPLDAVTRRSGLESANPVIISDGVWLGGRSVVCPGVTVGKNTVVSAGSVVIHDLPAGVLAAGVPCRPIRHLSVDAKAAATSGGC